MQGLTESNLAGKHRLKPNNGQQSMSIAGKKWPATFKEPTLTVQ